MQEIVLVALLGAVSVFLLFVGTVTAVRERRMASASGEPSTVELYRQSVRPEMEREMAARQERSE